MNPSFEHTFEIFLEFPAGNLNNNSQRIGSSFFHVVYFRSNDFDFAVFNLIHWFHSQQLKAISIFPAKLDIHILFSNSFTFKSGTEGHRNGDFLARPRFCSRAY